MKTSSRWSLHPRGSGVGAHDSGVGAHHITVG
jgi:hypothetical protein